MSQFNSDLRKRAGDKSLHRGDVNGKSPRDEETSKDDDSDHRKPHKSTSNIRHFQFQLIVLLITVMIVLYFGFPRKVTVDSCIGKLGKFKHSAVASDSPLCSTVGKEILDRKNATFADSAVATTLCLGVVNFHNRGIGGDIIFAIYRKSEGRFYSLDARGAAPSSASTNMYHGKPGRPSLYGKSAVGVPGEIAGLWELHKKFGGLPWKDLFQPAIELCRNGFPIVRALHVLLLKYNPKVSSGMEPFMKDTKTREIKDIGDIVKLPKLGQTLEDISNHGAHYFYSGKLADMMVGEIGDKKIISKPDFANYKAKWRKPVLIDIDINFEKLTLGAMPPPSGGACIGFILKTLTKFPKTLSDMETDPVRSWHRFMEISKFAYAARAKMGDVDFVNMTDLLNELSSNNFTNSVRSAILEDSVHPVDFYGDYFMKTTNFGTSHFSVLDKHGDAVAVTGSINQYFGSRIIGDKTGIVYNGMMDDFSLPGRNNLFGLPTSESNFIKPGKRPMTSMSPIVIVDESGDVRYVIGGSGGSRIISAVAQVLWRSLFFQKDLKEATDPPRIYEQWLPVDAIHEHEVDANLLENLKKLGHSFEPTRWEFASVVQSIERKNGKVFAYSEAKKQGCAAGT